MSMISTLVDANVLGIKPTATKTDDDGKHFTCTYYRLSPNPLNWLVHRSRISKSLEHRNNLETVSLAGKPWRYSAHSIYVRPHHLVINARRRFNTQ